MWGRKEERERRRFEMWLVYGIVGVCALFTLVGIFAGSFNDGR